MKHPFVQTLIEMGIYDEYFKELKRYREQRSQEFYRKECNHMTSSEQKASETISGSFAFYSSTQGTIYWAKICNEINNVYNRVNQETT